MSDLRQAIKRMRNVTRKLRTEDADFPQLTHIQAAVQRLAESENRYEMSSPTDVKTLLKKLKKGEELSSREVRDLPFILYAPKCDMELFAHALRELNLWRASHVRRLLYVYLMNYDRSDKTRQISTRLHNWFKAGLLQTSNPFLRSAKKHALSLFGGKCMDNMAVLFIQQRNVDPVMRLLNFPPTVKGGNFLTESLKTFFGSNKLPVAQKYEMFREIREDEGVSHSVFPTVANALIPQIDTLPPKEQADYKKDAMDAFYRLLGDPRFGIESIRWNAVSDDTRRIFLHWLAENDLELFFKIIKETAVDRMWSERKKFWKRYLPHISETKVFFGTRALEYARSLDGMYMRYGELKGIDPKHSILVFRMGRFTFVEWSHNGALRVWMESDARFFFHTNEIHRSNVVYAQHEEEWYHRGDWQSKVQSWIRKHCGINV